MRKSFKRELKTKAPNKRKAAPVAPVAKPQETKPPGMTQKPRQTQAELKSRVKFTARRLALKQHGLTQFVQPEEDYCWTAWDGRRLLTDCDLEDKNEMWFYRSCL